MFCGVRYWKLESLCVVLLSSMLQPLLGKGIYYVYQITKHDLSEFAFNLGLKHLFFFNCCDEEYYLF